MQQMSKTMGWLMLALNVVLLILTCLAKIGNKVFICLYIETLNRSI